MDPVSLTIAAVGLGMQIFGGFGQAKIAGQQAQVSADEAKQEQGINDAKQRAMELESRRANLQSIRVNQRMQAQATAAATNQGAQFGSGLQGGLAQITDQSLVNMYGVNAATQTGREINQFNQNISQDKMQMAALGGKSATDQGISSLGGAAIKAGPIIGQISKGFGGGSVPSPGLSLTGTGGLY